MDQDTLDDLVWPPKGILPTLELDLEKLLDPSRLQLHHTARSAALWPRNINVETIFAQQAIPISTTLKPIKHHSTDEIVSWTEEVTIGDGKTNDLTMKRPPLPPHLATRGNPSRLPFLPSCFIEDKKKPILKEEVQSKHTFLGEALLSNIPSMNIGVNFADDGYSVLHEKDILLLDETDKSAMDQSSILDNTDSEIQDTEDHLAGLWSDTDSILSTSTVLSEQQKAESLDQNSVILEKTVIDNLPNLPILNISTHESKKEPSATEWVQIMDISKPIDDFEQRVPNMAHKFPFELDTFQKLAILKLEEQGHVFVAAHTSAGKTVVAEYAIALSLKHCTRIIYTSPVKALSNQKYREFSRTFGDVGLLTGDIQINTTASCLVMTTEILRSMLYYGADVIRDLEYVIFDEVHYINDAQRGYVWEEVLILLPAHCGIVMLSATVPNTLEFADWVGRTKKRMVYVVSTTKRPVALCHYLYTGTGGASKNNRFLILDQEGKFLKHGYDKACKSRLTIKNPKHQNKGMSQQQEKGMWIGLIDHLQKHDKLPVVVFILSRKRCDTTAQNLISQDLTTAKEKSRIHMFIQACLKKLNESDRKLPQVTSLQTLLACGIGVHHSGILPILKEVVEMLFQLGLVKILFATETFAVGVNMPAKTVIFDSITKYDGLAWRALQPSEYIQMAGRAGRRGLDDTGTVIILCKKEVPQSSELVNMMLGKPSKLSSQFRVTYATMLGLLRVTNLSIESMMKSSFREFGVQSKTSTHKLEIQSIYQTLSRTIKTANYEVLGRFCDTALNYYQEITDIMPVIYAQRMKDLNLGKVVVICYEKYAYQFAIILGYTGTRSSDFRVMVLEYSEAFYRTPAQITNHNLWYVFMSYAGHSFKFNEEISHTIITIKPKHILRLTTCRFKGDCQKVLHDFDSRLHMKMKSPIPNSVCIQAFQMLSKISYNFYMGIEKVEFVDIMKGLKINKGEILESLNRTEQLKKQLSMFGVPCNHATFYQEFPHVFNRKQLEWKIDNLERLLSTEEMSLYPEYQKRLEVLKELRYIDAQHHVAIKGRVACELGKNELMITEIVFRNILTDLNPAEISALLSCLVVEARIQLKSPQKIAARLEERIISIQHINDDLTELEKKFDVGSDDPMSQSERLNFGLVEVIYEWAQGKNFCDIIQITDVQEGIIVHSIQKLHEVLMNVRDVANIIGDPILQSKMDEASLSIKRDIVFAASLYTQDDINLNF